MQFRAAELERIFASCFFAEFQTVLIGGGEEPLYRPSVDPLREPHRVVYREDYFASALHEVAHWCVAGAARRLQEDYGYWYSPDGRTEDEQASFERVERRPQAIEWIFSDACGFPFNLSADNLAAGLGPSDGFRRGVETQKAAYFAYLADLSDVDVAPDAPDAVDTADIAGGDRASSAELGACQPIESPERLPARAERFRRGLCDWRAAESEHPRQRAGGD